MAAIIEKVKKECPHCEILLTKKSYDAHKRLYYDENTGWIKKRRLTSDEEHSRVSATEQAIEQCAFDHGLEEDQTRIEIDAPPLVDFCDEIAETTNRYEGYSDDVNPVEHALESSTTTVTEVWSENEEDLDINFAGETSQAGGNTIEVFLVKWLAMFFLRIQSQHYIPDAAIDSFLKLFYVLFVILGRFSDLCKSISQSMPRSIYSLRKLIGLKDTFQQLVVCQDCNSIYPMKDCIDRPGVSKQCKYRAFPRSSVCNSVLLKTVELASRKKILYPIRVYCYNSLKSSLDRLFAQPDFVELCEHWRKRNNASGVMSDVYDGNIWLEFQVVSGQPFLAAPFNLAFSLNIDWFQPYKLTQSSVGVIYLTILNLPRSVRNSQKYVLLAGIIPGPHEPKRDINSFLKPLVDELQLLWSGQYVRIPSLPNLQLVRAALVCIACDLPASKKVAGFLGHTAKLGCSKCLKVFSGGFGNTDYSGFNRALWPPRTKEGHYTAAKRTTKCPNKTQRQKLESQLGCRYSILLNLEYFDPIRMVIIDPMHNIFLGSAKHVIKKLWIRNGILTDPILLQMQEFVNNVHVPPDIGRLPRKLETGFSGFTAAQFKNWVNLYSIPALFGKVSTAHLECWRHLVLACRLLCKISITTIDIQKADILLLHFCKKIEQLFGNAVITPNMHLHGHLKGVIEDFGPLHGFWLFAYERFNGILGNYPNNNKSIEPQLMKKFLYSNIVLSAEFPPEYREEFSSLQKDYFPNAEVNLYNNETIVYPPNYRIKSLTNFDLTSVQVVLSKKLAVPPSSIFINSCIKQYSSLEISGKVFNSCMKRSSHNYIALSLWDINVFGTPPSRLPQPVVNNRDEHLRPIEIEYFAGVTYTVNEAEPYSSEIFAVASWFSPHPNRYDLGKPADIWCKSLFEISGPHSYIPCSLIKFRCAYSFSRIEALQECVLIVVPIIE